MTGVGRPADLASEYLALEYLAARHYDNADELAGGLARIYQTIHELDLDAYDLAQAKASAPSLMQALFDLRLLLRSRIASWHEGGLTTPAVVKGLRDVFRVSRYGGDVLGELYLSFDQSRRGRRAFTGGCRKTHVNPAYYDGHDLAFRSGDVIAMRGTHHNSAAIARIGDVDSQFSHVGLVYIDPEDRHWFVESLIETSAVITRLEYVLDHGVARAALYRHPDEGLAKNAAEFIHGRVRKAQGRWGRPIRYDFSFRLDDYDELFCSKLVRQAYDAASGGKLKIPAFKTRLDMKNRDFFDRIGVKASETFAPGDVDLETSFDLVAEWQDYRQTSRLRLQDLIMDKIFEWMELYGYRFQETAAVRTVSILGRAASYLSEDAKELLKDTFPRVPTNMSRRTVAVVAMLHKTGEELLTGLQAFEDDTIRMRGRPASAAEISSYLERVRQSSDGAIGYLVAPQ